MVREKTALEKSETPELEAARLRGALFTIAGLEDMAEIKRVALAAMRGELHGHEPPVVKLPSWLANQVDMIHPMSNFPLALTIESPY